MKKLLIAGIVCTVLGVCFAGSAEAQCYGRRSYHHGGRHHSSRHYGSRHRSYGRHYGHHSYRRHHGYRSYGSCYVPYRSYGCGGGYYGGYSPYYGGYSSYGYYDRGGCFGLRIGDSCFGISF